MRTRLTLAACLAIVAGCTSPARSDCNPDGTLIVPAGFCAALFADGVRYGRHITVADDGRVFVILLRPADIEPSASVIALFDSDGDGRADRHDAFGNIFGSDIEWRDRFLYVSSPMRVARYHLGEGEMTSVLPAETVVSDLPQSFGMEHTSRPFAFGDDGSLYIHIGSTSNSCQQENRIPGSPGIFPCPTEASAGLWKFPRDRIGLKFPDDGQRIASGLRHTRGIVWNAEASALQFVQQGRDELHELFPDKFSQRQSAVLPPEELLEVQVSAVVDFGWPYCFYDHIQGVRVLSPEYGGDGHLRGECAKYPTPLLTFPAHTSPSDMLLYSGRMFPERYRNGAFISFAGGWGRRPYDQLGFNVSFVPFVEGRPVHPWEVFADGFSGRPNIRVPNDAVSRPSGLAQMPDGSVLVLDGRAGKIWRISYG